MANESFEKPNTVTREELDALKNLSDDQLLAKSADALLEILTRLEVTDELMSAEGSVRGSIGAGDLKVLKDRIEALLKSQIENSTPEVSEEELNVEVEQDK